MLYNILIPVAMFVFSLDGYNAINYCRLWYKCHKALRGVA